MTARRVIIALLPAPRAEALVSTWDSYRLLGEPAPRAWAAALRAALAPRRRCGCGRTIFVGPDDLPLPHSLPLSGDRCLARPA